MLPKYKVLTSFSCLDISAEYEQRERDMLFEEELDILTELNISYDYFMYRVHFFESQYTHDFETESTINEAIQRLAIKDGADLVQFDNSNYGYVAYYNGIKNGFEIIGEVNEEVD